jgi:hypothetical protein
MIGDAVSFMTPLTKKTRRTEWQKLNFAGTIDWAVDLQSFTADDGDPDSKCSDGDRMISTENVPAGSYTPGVLKETETETVGGNKQYITIGM